MATLTESEVLNLAVFSADFAKREILRRYIDVIDDSMGFFDWMDFTGRAVLTGKSEYDNVTDSSVFKTAIVKTTSTIGVANTP